MAENEINDALQEQNPAEEAEIQDVSVGQAGEVGYAPSTVEINRSRIQGAGVGQTELNQQRDPTTRDSSEKY